MFTNDVIGFDPLGIFKGFTTTATFDICCGYLFGQ
jgi:hypothetical protein